MARKHPAGQGRRVKLAPATEVNASGGEALTLIYAPLRWN